MKAGMFMLTKSEQRVVVLVVLALLIAAFVRYWRDVNSAPAPAPLHNESPATVNPSPEEKISGDQD